MTQTQRPDEHGRRPSGDDKANKMDRPLPGSGDDPTPKPVASGFTEPIEDAAEVTEAPEKGKKAK